MFTTLRVVFFRTFDILDQRFSTGGPWPIDGPRDGLVGSMIFFFFLVHSYVELHCKILKLFYSIERKIIQHPLLPAEALMSDLPGFITDEV